MENQENNENYLVISWWDKKHINEKTASGFSYAIPVITFHSENEAEEEFAKRKTSLGDNAKILMCKIEKNN